MAVDKDVLIIGKELEKLIAVTPLNEDKAADLLQTLKGMQVTVEALRVSGRWTVQ
jgi:hypothetical protein